MDLLARANELKPELVHYATSGRFARELSAVLDRFYADGPAADEAAAFLPVDYFAHQHRLPGGDTVIDRFLGDHPGLDERDRRLLESWKDVVEGIFEVRTVGGSAVELFNLIDELTYRTRSNLGEGAFEPLSPGMFVVGRVIPLGLEWLISGTPAVHPESARELLTGVAAHVAIGDPRQVFRNPSALAAARELQTAQRRCFVSYFGTDLVVLPGARVAERMRGYLDYQAGHLDGPPVPLELPEHVGAAESVALIFDEAYGLAYYTDFAALEEVFADPRLAERRRYRDLLTTYLRGESVSPVPIQRLAARDQDKAGQVFARLLGKPGFRWDRSGDRLLRTHKPGHFDGPRLPAVTPMTQAVLTHLNPGPPDAA